MVENEIQQLKKKLDLERRKSQHIFSISHKYLEIISSNQHNKINLILQAILDGVIEVLDSESGSILLVEDNFDEMSIYAAKGLSEDIIKNTRIKIGDGISGWIVKNKKSLLVQDIEKDSRFARQSGEKYNTKSLIGAPIQIDNKVLGVININNKQHHQVYDQDDLDLLLATANYAALIISNLNLYDKLELLYINTIEALAEAIDARDHYTKSHSEHVCKYAMAIAKEMNLPQNNIEVIERAARLHDIGKIGVHDAVLNKPGKLTDEEWAEIKTHSLKGAQILEPLAYLEGVIKTVRQHHERFDGTGYPYNITGSEIRIEARVLAVADTFDAMTTNRSYAKAMTQEEAIKELKRVSGKQLDSDAVNALLRVLKKGTVKIAQN